ncbi:MAG: amidohydrolase [Gammaproteobacteria bacterium]
MRSALIVLCACTALSSVALAAAPAETAYRNGRIYTVESGQAWAEAVAISGGRFVYVGNEQGLHDHVGAGTKVVDLQGRMVMPGIHDAHQHLLVTGMRSNFDCAIPDNSDVTAIIAALRKCAAGKPKGEWIIANVYRPDLFPGGKAHRRYLDEAFPDTPIYIREWSWHHALANSRALQIAGVTRSTPDPQGGRVLRDERGEPRGELLEKATWLVQKALPAPSAETVRTALKWSAQMCSQVGITSAQEASATRELLEGVKALDERGEWPLELASHIVWDNPEFGNASAADLDRLIDNRARYASAHQKTDFVKIIIDGSPLQPHTTDVSLDSSGHVPVGKLLEEPQKLNAALIRFDRLGIKAKMHVTGTGAARVALDAIEAARKANPNSRVRQEVAHSVRFDPVDLPRVAKLGAVAELSPAIWQIKGELTENLVGAFPFKSLQASGALITAGTDWVILPTPNLFPALGGMVDHGSESIDLRSAIEAITLNGARSVGWEERSGSIKVGKLANMIVLDRNLFDIPTAQIADTRVLQTVFEGKVVYDAAGNKAAASSRSH